MVRSNDLPVPRASERSRVIAIHFKSEGKILSQVIWAFKVCWTFDYQSVRGQRNRLSIHVYKIDNKPGTESIRIASFRGSFIAQQSFNDSKVPNS